MKLLIIGLIVLAIGAAIFFYITSFSMSPKEIEQLRIDADSGNAQAQLKLGRTYFSGQGVAKDYNQALIYFKKAAIQGNAEAQFNLGSMYYMGYGVVPVDFGTAYKWVTLSLKNGYDAGKVILPLLQNGLTQDQKIAGDKWAAEWKQGNSE